MSMIEDLVRRSLGDVSAEVKRGLIRELEAIGKDVVVPMVADTVSRTVVKSLDAVVGAAVRALPVSEQAERLTAAYLAELQDQLDQLNDAVFEYVPYQLQVELAKKSFGNKSAEANAARAARASFIEGLRSEVRDVFRVLAGEEVAD